LTGPAYHGAASIVPWIALAYWMHIAIYQLQIVVIDYRRRTELILWLTGPAAFLNIVLNIALVPRFGIRAAALNTVVGFLYASVMARWFALRLGPIAYPWTTITANAAIAVAAYGFGITFLTGPGLVESIVAKGMVLVAAGAIMLPMCGFSLRDAARLLETLRRPVADEMPAMAE
jgi:O-antigen/teichoic acid export membrane protein